ncbi:hypothetical protein HLPR_16450 [Helicovermis profundi]|uniref:Uncharacterized protein n=1 Tax=Helicovermis profundi TaxID=3065157 RepID=A0AAU9ED90_9FIRM|nr:hypothetical protein HLPR_16450 [Clostridia bacterium S502]
MPFTPLAEKSSFSAALIIPKGLVPFLSFPAASLIFVISILNPYCFETTKRQADHSLLRRVAL